MTAVGCLIAKRSANEPDGATGDKQSGQALVLGLVVAGVAAVALVALYNVGQVALARARLTHATDAAAYSAALIQARTLNMLAHVQRAQVAHQIAIAHLASLGAWSRFSDNQHRMHSVGNPPGMIIGRLFGYAHKQAFARSGVEASGTRAALEKAIADHDSLAHDVLAHVGDALTGTLERARASVIHQVLQANLPDLVVNSDAANEGADVLAVVRDDTWPILLKRLPGNAAEGSRRLVEAAASRYGFLRKRHHTAFNPWAINPVCPWMLHTLQRRGASWLDEGGRWQAVDTQSFHARRFNRYIGCYYREYTMGWAATRGETGAVSQEQTTGIAAPPNFSQEAYWRWARRATRWDLRLAENRVGALRAMMTAWSPAQRGLSALHTLRASGQSDATFRLDVAQRSQSVATTNAASRIMLRVGRFLFPGLGTGAWVRARAGAQTYFSPPQGKTKRDSGASTFRPYWRARLIPLSAATATQAGQAMLESIIMVALLCALIASAMTIGQHGFRALGSEHTSRWLAFTADRVVAAHAFGLGGSGSTPSTGVEQGARLQAQPGGRTRHASEMRQAWAYADAGLTVGHAGVHRTAVLRDSGHHADDRATQTRIGRSVHAWRQAAGPALRIASRINGQAAPSDRAWRRPALSLDWLGAWFDLDQSGVHR